MPISYQEIEKPSAPTYSERLKPLLLGFLLLENGAFMLNEAAGYYEIDNDDYDVIGKPSAPTYQEILRPT